MSNWMDFDRLQAEAENIKALFPSLGNRYVPGEGNEENPDAFIVGVSPGAQEEIRTRPFIGHEGIVLRQLMKLADLGPSQCWMTNLVKFRLPGNRTPVFEEVQYFRTLLQQEWRLVNKPKLIIAIGQLPLVAVLGKPIDSARNAGHPIDIGVAVVWPMQSPRKGIHSKPKQVLIERDWERLGKWRERNG